MIDEFEAHLISSLRELMGLRSISVREMAAKVGVPYRTLQNQLLGKARLPASTYMKVVNEVGLRLPGQLQDLDENALASALEQCLGGQLPTISPSGPQTVSILPPPNPDTRDEASRFEDARRLTFFVAATYYAELRSKAAEGPQRRVRNADGGRGPNAG